MRYDPSNVEAHYDLGLVLSALGESGAALREFEVAVRLKPDFGLAHASMAEILYDAGKYDDSWREVRAARAAHAEVNPELVTRLGARGWR